MIVAIVAAAAAAAQGDPPAPVLDLQFSVHVNQTVNWQGVWNFEFMYHYDAVHGVSRIDYGKGQHDEECTGVVGKEGSDEPCTEIVARDGWRYLLYPADGTCCRLCNVTAGCGILSPTWLSGAQYIGKMQVANVTCNGWLQQGEVANYYYATADQRQVPCLYYEPYPDTGEGMQMWNYSIATYRTGPQDPALFDIPATCTSDCQMKTLKKHQPK